MIPKTRALVAKLNEYIPGKSKEEVCAKWNLDSVIKLASNENPLGQSSKVQETIRSLASEVHLYPQGHAPKLTEVLAEHLSIQKENIVFSNGSDELIWLLATAFLNPEDECLSSEHTFSEYRFCSALLEGQYRNVPPQDWIFDLEAILTSVTSRTKLIFLCNPNNPTGTYVTKEQVKSFLDKVPSDIVVVLDQAYVEYADADDYPTAIGWWDEHPNLVLLRTFSKIYGLAGLRIGYALGHPDLIRALYKIKQPFNVNLIAQEAALTALQDQNFVQKSLATNSKGKLALQQFFDEKAIKHLPTQANFLSFEIGSKAAEFVSFCESQGLILRYLASFGMPTWVRITIGQANELELFFTLYNRWEQQS